MDIETVKNYLRVDYDDDDELILLMLDAVLDEMSELIKDFDRDAPTVAERSRRRTVKKKCDMSCNRS